MGSPWPWSQEPVRTPSSGSSITPIHNNNNNNNNVNGNIKREPSFYSMCNSSYYSNQRNHEFHQQNVFQSTLPHLQQNSNPSYQIRFPLHAQPEPMLANGYAEDRKRHGISSFSNFEAAQQNQLLNTNNNNNDLPKIQNSTQSQFATHVKEIPTWNIYFSDQKHRLSDFTDKNNSIRADSYINQLVSLCLGDTCITNFAVDAIVNSTTEEYSGTAGVDKLIHDKAGKSLRDACKSLQRLGAGEADMSLGFNLPAKYVIHTNGPLTEDAEQLTGCYVNSLNLLLMHSLRTIVFPCISTGKKGLSKKFAADTALRTVRYFLEDHRHEVDRVIFCLHHQRDIEIYLRYMQIYFPVVPDRDVQITIV